MKRVALLACFLAIFVAACGTLGVQAHSIALAYKAGDVYTYNFHLALKYKVASSGFSMPLDLDLKAKETVTVKSVDSSGTGDVSLVLSSVSVTTAINGTTTTTNSTSTTTAEMKIAADGHIVSVNGSAISNSSFPGMTSSTQGGFVTAILADHPVKPGEAWSKSYDVPNPYGSGTSKMTSDSTYLRDEKIGSANTSVIESKMKLTIDMSLDLTSLFGGSGMTLTPAAGSAGALQSMALRGSGTADVTSYIDASAHRVVKTHSTGTFDATISVKVPSTASTPSPGPVLGGPITLKGTQTLDMNPV